MTVYTNVIKDRQLLLRLKVIFGVSFGYQCFIKTIGVVSPLFLSFNEIFRLSRFH